MNTHLDVAHFRRWAAGIGLLAVACLLNNTAEAQRPSIAALQSQIAALQANNVPNLAGYVTMDVSNPSRPTLRVAGANLQVVNGTGHTVGAPNGLGNVIVGYDEARSTGILMCSDGFQPNQTACVNNGYVWNINHKSGSHNVVVGALHNYSQYGSLVAGFQNAVLSSAASVSGGIENIAYTLGSSVSGGYQNTARGTHASVSGGNANAASGDDASVSGGQLNQATGGAASVGGGRYGVASGGGASVSGGDFNNATQNWASVSGGWNNSANGQWASISGGGNNLAPTSYAAISGGFANYAAGQYSSVSGGNGGQANNDYDWVGGTLHSP